MTAAARAGRARRGRVMIVGDVPDAPSIAARLAQPPVIARTIFDALGEVTVAPAGAPIATILVSPAFLRSESAHALEALRKVDPSVRVVLVAPPGGGGGGGATDELESFARLVDDRVVAPLKPEDYQRLFDEAGATDGPVATPRPAPPAHAPPAPAPALGGPVFEIPDEPAEPPAPSPLGQPARHAHAAAIASAIAAPIAGPTERAEHPLPPAAASEQASERLGDTDLLEAIMRDARGVQTVALQLIVQQTGWRDIAITDASPRPEAPAGCVVAFAGQTFGALSSALATRAQLEPWAEWLARWLALDHAYRAHRLMAYQDELTGAWNRRFFHWFLDQSIAAAAPARRPITVMVFDIDNFKSYNDRFGHAAGDEILRETVRLMTSGIRQGDRVCRIGGDEFAVVFADPEGPRAAGSTPPETVEQITRRFQDQVSRTRFPKLGVEAPGTLSISGGLATFPWDGADSEALLRRADQLALESKRAGKNALTFGPGAQRECGA